MYGIPVRIRQSGLWNAAGRKNTPTRRELERELEEDPYADSEFSWLTDEPAEGTEPADAASKEPEKAQTMNMQTEETQTPQETKEEQQS